LIITQVTLQRYDAPKLVDFVVAVFTMLAIGRVNFVVGNVNTYVFQRPFLAPCIHTDRHAGARSKARGQQLIGRQSEIGAAVSLWFIREKCVLANSPLEWPRPVKSNRNTAIPDEARRCEIRFAAKMSLEQVKQWAKIAVARIRPSGVSNRAAKSSPEWPLKVSFSLDMRVSPCSLYKVGICFAMTRMLQSGYENVTFLT
jgi:hypothetical protein